LNQEFGWSEKGKRTRAAIPPRSKSRSMIAAITDSRILGCQIVKVSGLQEDYLGFLTKLIQGLNLKRKK